jgi:spore maturation protein CgeB
MNSGPWRILVVGEPDGVNLESSYARALAALGHQVAIFAFETQLRKYIRLGRFGRLFHAFAPVSPWLRKVNRELVVAALKKQPDLLIVFGSTQIQVGALAQIRASTQTHLAWVWPDTLLNLTDGIVGCLPLFHSVFSYSAIAVPLLQRLHAERVAWLPLAGDPLMHNQAELSPAEENAFAAEISFIGGWRPEREAALRQLLHLKLKIWGPDWGRLAREPHVRRAWQGRALRGSEFAKAVSASLLNLNVIDDTNTPAANMRFFEIPTAGGAQLCSPCPEMAAQFRDREHVFYYITTEDLPALAAELLKDQTACRTVARAGRDLVLAQHTYEHRAQAMCRFVSSN